MTNGLKGLVEPKNCWSMRGYELEKIEVVRTGCLKLVSRIMETGNDKSRI